MLSDFQRRHPNRAVSSSNRETYLERALNEGRLDEVEIYWKDGALLKALKKNQNVHVGLAQGYLVSLSKNQNVEAWKHLWEALQKEVPLTDKEWSLCLARSRYPGSRHLFTETIHEWIGKGANPFQQAWHYSHCFFLNWWEPVLNATSYRPPSEELIQHVLKSSQTWLEEASHRPQWFYHHDAQTVLPTIMWRLCTKKEQLPPEIWSHLKAWQELFTQQGINPLWVSQGGTSAFKQVLSSYLAKPLDKIKLCKDLLSGQFEPGSRTISAYDFVEIFKLTPDSPGVLLKDLARHQQFPWGAELTFSQEREKETSVGLLIKHLQEKPQPFNWEDLLKTLGEIAQQSPPPSKWVSVALRSWLDHQFAIASKNKTFVFEDLKSQWEGWRQIGGWELGLPEDIVQVIGSFMERLTTDKSIEYPILREGLEMLWSCPQGPLGLFRSLGTGSYSRNWAVRGLFQLWEHVLNDKNQQEPLRMILKNPENITLQNALWPAWGTLTTRMLYRSENPFSTLDHWLLEFKPMQWFGSEPLPALIQESQTPSVALKALDRVSSLSLSPSSDVEKTKMWKTWFAITDAQLKRVAHSVETSEKETHVFIEKMKKWGASLDEGLQLAVLSKDGEGCIIPILEAGANPLSVPAPEQVETLSSQLLLSWQEKARLAVLSEEVGTSLSPKSKWRI